jgi:hypothetical protein
MIHNFVKYDSTKQKQLLIVDLRIEERFNRILADVRWSNFVLSKFVRRIGADYLLAWTSTIGGA